ncbi:hypothetical protein [Mesorhizobium sp. M1A.F.Ca.IN.020.06.1.1]|uniref:hypothetical protein n=1 Tax=Mesorhizobium sp. M1A.F.Ca.IN.020.06.1.1 TaxID=2496765 RepID=UPI0019D47B89|nr:hypothetical protein [Mesorhizobium sp. M1A.F.Ca.IN.020.06.1.1]
MADGDGEFRREAEIWKLGALLLNPDRQMEARRYARALMARSMLEPSVIAWLLHCGVPMRRGKVKKKLGDLLRRGEGTPGHVVVLALMASRLDSPRPGLAVVRRFGPSFPEAAEFFAMWRKQLGEDAGPPEENYSSAVRWAIGRRDNLPLMAFLSGTGASVENLASGAEFLSSTRSYADVLSLREKLFEIGTVRALELVARAANRTKEYSIALQAIEHFRGDALPNRLRYPRIEAHEGLGQHSQVIADLRGMLADDNNARVHDRLLHAYLRVGNLRELKIETEKALAARRLDSRQAVQIAYALRTASPETARQALEQVGDADIPAELAGILLNLANSLGGFDDLKDEMVRRIVTGGEGFGTVRKFDTVEEILAYMKERADEYRQAFGQWLAGQVPAALAMRGDEKAYGSLFLGSGRSRRNNIGDAFPMLLLGHGALQPAPEVVGNPELVVDLSGILLAHRLKLLDDLDKVFRVMVPGTLPQALFQLRQQYSGPSREVAATILAIESGSSAVKVVDTAPEGAVRVEMLCGSGNDDEWMAPTLLEHAFENGHLTRDEVEAAVRGLDLEKPPERRALPGAGVSLSATAVAHLAQLKVLEPIARSLPTCVLVGDARRLSDDVETLREEESIGASLDGLQQVVADRLTSSAWRTRPDTYHEKDEERLESLPAHVRCLMDTLPTDEAKRGVLFWIEDRALSKQRFPEALYLTDILSLLMDRGLLSSERHETILRDLWSNGYSFMPGSEQEIVRVLEQAPIVDGEVVENGVLTDIRRWFAIQASNLAYIEPNLHVDADGNVVGETRQLIELATLLKETLLSIWRHPDQTLEQRLARSAWVSIYLRLEHAPGAMADTTPAGRRRLASLIPAQIISVPLFAELTSEKMSDADRQMYVNWALSVVDVTRNADPELFSDIVEILAGMASRILEDPPETDESLRRKLRAHMRNIVHRFLSLLPSEWYDAIAARNGVAEALGSERVTTLEVADGITVRIADLPTAIREAESSGKKVKFPLHNSKDSARLESEAVEDDLPLIFLTIKKRRYNFDRTSIALVHPDISLREKAVEALRSAARVDRDISDATARVILDETDVDRRVLLFDEARGGEFRRQIEVMRERVRHGRALSIDGFDLPSPAVIFDFLGLPPDYRGDAASLAADATAALLESLGADGALERLSGLPFELPRALLDAQASQTSSENDRRYWDSPLWAVSRFVARGAPDPDSSEVDEYIGQLIQAGRGIFSGLVRRTAKRAINDARWQEMPVDVNISLIWTFAEHVSRAILPAGFETASFNQWLAQNDVATFTEFERQRLWPRWAQTFGLRLTSSRVDAAIVSRLLKAGFEPSESLQALAGMQRGEAWSPTVEAGSAAVVAPQGFWPAQDPIPLYIDAGWLSSDSPFSLRTDTAMARRIVEESTQNSTFVGPALTLLVEVESVDQDVLIEIRKTISKRLVDAPLDRTEPSHRAQLEIFAKACARLGDADLFERTISSVASTNARIWPHKRLKAAQDDESTKALEALLHAAQWFAATVGGDLSSQMRQFARHVAQIVDAWPMSILAAISCLDVVARKVDASTAAEAVWPVLMELRTRR